MAEKYLYGSLIAAGIGVFAGMYLGVEAVPLLFILATGIFFVIFCYIIGLLKDIRAKLETREIGSEEKFFVEVEKGTEKAESADTAIPETKAPDEDAGK